MSPSGASTSHGLFTASRASFSRPTCPAPLGPSICRTVSPPWPLCVPPLVEPFWKRTTVTFSEAPSSTRSSPLSAVSPPVALRTQRSMPLATASANRCESKAAFCRSTIDAESHSCSGNCRASRVGIWRQLASPNLMWEADPQAIPAYKLAPASGEPSAAARSTGQTSISIPVSQQNASAAMSTSGLATSISRTARPCRLSMQW